MTRETFDRLLSELQQQLLKLSSMVEGTIHLAVESLAKQDQDLAQQIIDADDQIDDLVRKIEADCIRVIALQQPLARDLRVVTTVLRIALDLERIADNASNIAEITIRIGKQPLIGQLEDIPKMAELAETMVRKSIKALVDRDAAAAKANCLQDERVDEIYRALLNETTDFVMGDADRAAVVQGINLLFVARFLERVADHATNIGERVIYLVTGRNEHY
ncbi:MAG TPA: phosphate signaling complex protein PhoU [Bacillota bacterium]